MKTRILVIYYNSRSSHRLDTENTHIQDTPFRPRIDDDNNYNNTLQYRKSGDSFPTQNRNRGSCL